MWRITKTSFENLRVRSDFFPWFEFFIDWGWKPPVFPRFPWLEELSDCFLITLLPSKKKGWRSKTFLVTPSPLSVSHPAPTHMCHPLTCHLPHHCNAQGQQNKWPSWPNPEQFLVSIYKDIYITPHTTVNIQHPKWRFVPKGKILGCRHCHALHEGGGVSVGVGGWHVSAFHMKTRTKFCGVFSSLVSYFCMAFFLQSQLIIWQVLLFLKPRK